ncbi:MAG: secretion protein F [Rhodococcus sp.]|uniref:type II secretion system F family protein n=1 Tax=Rhodococcus sp. TaxID=1831 RepID=UPI0016A21415|nr:type II secretion system F family protein [Rhodococcus sp. (in: high G+C Gram-positive bacteria)]NLV78169.1 secretion protein F [Rhodococcus sp. (in: high G+C Gram-positive bacteria)]
MTAPMLCLAAAVLIAPGSGAAERITRSRIGSSRTVPVGVAHRDSQRDTVLAVAAVTAAVFLGAGPALTTAVLAATVLLRRRRNRRVTRIAVDRRMLMTGLESVVAELRVGAHPADACDTACRDTTGPASDAFRSAAARARLGGSASEGFRAAAAGSDPSGIGESLTRVADAWSVSDEHGLALAELLDAARADLAARMRVRARTEAGLAGARATATVLAALPGLGVVLGELMGADPVDVLLGDGPGTILLVLGTCLTCAGLLWSDHIAARVGR